MQAGKRSFVLYMDNHVWIRDLSDKQKGRLLDALFDYAEDVCLTGRRPREYLEETLHGMESNTVKVFGFMADSIYRDTGKWKKAQETRAAKKAKEEGGEKA